MLQWISIPVGDERAVHVALSEAGSRMAAQIHGQVTTWVAEIVTDLSAAHRGCLSSLLSRLVVAHDANQRGGDLDSRHARLGG